MADDERDDLTGQPGAAAAEGTVDRDTRGVVTDEDIADDESMPDTTSGGAPEEPEHQLDQFGESDDDSGEGLS